MGGEGTAQLQSPLLYSASLSSSEQGAWTHLELVSQSLEVMLAAGGTLAGEVVWNNFMGHGLPHHVVGKFQEQAWRGGGRRGERRRGGGGEDRQKRRDQDRGQGSCWRKVRSVMRRGQSSPVEAGLSGLESPPL